MKRKALLLLERHPRALASVGALVAVGRSLVGVRRSWRSRAALRVARARAPRALARVTTNEPVAFPPSSVVLSSARRAAGAAIVKMGPHGGPPDVVVKTAATAEGEASLRRAAEMLVALRSEPAIGALSEVVPVLIGVVDIDGQVFSVETALPGVSGHSLLADRTRSRAMVASAARVVTELHRRTLRHVDVDEEILDAWVISPARVIVAACGNARGMDTIVRALVDACTGCSPSMSWIHGDYWPGNVLVSPGHGRITGIVDWKWSSPAGLPHHDLLHLLIYARMSATRSEIGDIIASLLNGGAWDEEELRILDAAAVTDVGLGGGAHTSLLLFWLRHISLVLTRSPHYARDWVWMTRNVESVKSVL